MVLIDADAFLFALPEADLERAIRLLDASSQQITARACGLTTQQTLLNTRGSRTASRLNVLQSDSNRNITTKSQHTRLTNEARLADLTDDIQTRLTILDKDSKAASATVNQCLKSNDRILDALGRDACTDTVATELSELSSRIQQLSHMLQIKGVTAVKDRLDRVYLTALESRTSRAELQTRAADVIPEVKQDIQSLYTEIEDVVVLMAGHEHLQKLEHSIAAASLEQRYQWEQTLQEAKLTVVHMTNQLDRFTLHIQRVQSQRAALLEISSHLTDQDHEIPPVTAQPDIPFASQSDPVHSQAVHTKLPTDAPDKLVDAVDFRTRLLGIKEILRSASVHRAQALSLLRAVEGATDTTSLDALDRRITTTSR